MTFKFDKTKNAVVNETGHPVLKITFRGREEDYISALLDCGCGLISIEARMTEIDDGKQTRKGWHVFTISVLPPNTRTPEIDAVLITALKAYAYTNGIGADEDVPVQIACEN